MSQLIRGRPIFLGLTKTKLGWPVNRAMRSLTTSVEFSASIEITGFVENLSVSPLPVTRPEQHSTRGLSCCRLDCMSGEISFTISSVQFPAEVPRRELRSDLAPSSQPLAFRSASAILAELGVENDLGLEVREVGKVEMEFEVEAYCMAVVDQYCWGCNSLSAFA
jgi:hypothetical protein